MFNIQKLFQDYNVTYAERGSNLSRGWISTDCPYCNSHKGHFAINPYNKQVNCWRCGSHHIVHAISLILCITEFEAKRVVTDYDDDNSFVQIPVEPAKPVDYVRLGRRCTQKHKDYLTGRGFDADYLIDKYKLRGTITTPTWENRIIIPIFKDGYEVCYQGRTIDEDEELRYRGCSRDNSIIHYKDLLYPEIKSDWVVVVEGIFDQYRLGGNSVCTFGTTLSLKQITLLAGYKQVFFAFDAADERGQQKAIKYCRMLIMMGCNAQRLQIDVANDPGDFTIEQVNKFWDFINGRI
jgi:hypothetical protein